jgi:hypothetical protein
MMIPPGRTTSKDRVRVSPPTRVEDDIDVGYLDLERLGRVVNDQIGSKVFEQMSARPGGRH